MKEYVVKQEDLEINIKYINDDDLIQKLDYIICNLISYGYGSWTDIGTDGMLKAIKENSLYDEDINLKNETYIEDIDI